jgi:NADPH-dependent 2,4-dienoyl-CoA reductase/sulfur reductase-like enzyme
MLGSVHWLSNNLKTADYVVIGGGLTGFYAAAELRKRDTSGKIVLVSEEPHLPYDRVPLSKDYLLGKRARERVFLRTKEFYDQQRIEVVSGRRAEKIDVNGRTIRLDDGSEFAFNRLLFATGGRPRRLTIPGSDLEGVFYLRTLDDCEKIREKMLKSRRAVVVGGGFIGCELVSVFRMSGLQTTIIEAASYPLNIAVDDLTGQWIADYFRSRGVRVITDTQASTFLGEDGRVEAVLTNRGETLEADLVAVGIGVIPNTELAEEAGLRVERGIVVNELLETDSEGVYAAGDVARFHSPIFNRHLRVEHYDVAVKQGAIAGANMTGERKTFSELPFFYSYTFDLRIRAYGDLSRKRFLVRRGSFGVEKGFFQLYFDDGVLDGFLSINGSFKESDELKRIILSRRRFSDPSELASQPLRAPQIVGLLAAGTGQA